MKTLLAVASLLLAATFAAAAETAAPAATQPPSPNDSPLVRAAKKANRLGRKPGFVITNENMHTLTAPARISTTNYAGSAPTVSAPPLQPPEVLAREKAEGAKHQADVAAALAKAKDEARRQKMERVAAEAEGADAIYVEDPATSEHSMQEAAPATAPPGSSSAPQPSQNVTKKP